MLHCLEDVVDGDQPGPVVYDRGNVVGACADCAAMFIKRLLHHPEEGIQDGDEQRAAEWAALQNARCSVELVVPPATAARDSVKILALCVKQGSLKCT